MRFMGCQQVRHDWTTASTELNWERCAGKLISWFWSWNIWWHRQSSLKYSQLDSYRKGYSIDMLSPEQDLGLKFQDSLFDSVRRHSGRICCPLRHLHSLKSVVSFHGTSRYALSHSLESLIVSSPCLLPFSSCIRSFIIQFLRICYVL